MKQNKKSLEIIDPFSEEYQGLTVTRQDAYYKELYEEIFNSIPTQARAAIAKGFNEYLKRSAQPFLSLMSPFNWFQPQVLLTNLQNIYSNSMNLCMGSSKYLHDLMVSAGIVEKSNTFFQVGVNIATTPCEVVYESPLLTLKRYIPKENRVYQTPLFMIYSIINAYYIMDLTAELSMIRYFVEQGYDLFVTDWKPVTEETKGATLEDYINEVTRAKRLIKSLTGQERVGGLGYCIGGTYVDMEAAINEGYAYIINLTTLLNSKVGEGGAGTMGAFSDFSMYDIDQFIERHNGVFPGDILKQFFDWVKPEKAANMFMDIYFYGREYKYANDAIYFWNTHSSRNVAGPAHRKYLWEIYHENNLAENRMRLFDTIIDLKHIKVPFCNVAALFDHIVPFPNALSTAHLIGTPREDQITIKVEGGHVRGVVNPALYPVLEEFTRKHSGRKDRSPHVLPKQRALYMRPHERRGAITETSSEGRDL